MKTIENNISEISNSSISIIGLGRSGVGAARLADHLGSEVFISDSSSSKTAEENLEILASIGIKGEIGDYSENVFNADLIVLSPGVPADSQVVLEAQDRGIKLIGEIEFASLFTDSPIVGVTGSNGKSTTVHALVEMCQSRDITGILAGNIGFPFSEKVLEELQDPGNNLVYILEISSFQMEFIEQFRPHIAIFLNISPDHLDRHKTFENYLAAKLRLAENQTGNDYVIFNADDQALAKRLDKSEAQPVTFSPTRYANSIYSVNNSNIINKEYAKLTKLENIGLPGRHNVYNLLAAASGAHCLGITDEKITAVMHSFKGIPHRLESIANINGVEFINDSKATNIDAVKVALESFNSPIILILGGLAKGNDFPELLQYKGKIKYVIAYGAAMETIHGELHHIFKVNKVDLLQDAVKLSQKLAGQGDIVLLSPGCASFDQFNNFEDRGVKFTQWVQEL